MVSRSYGHSRTDGTLSIKQHKFWARENGNNNSDRRQNDPTTPNIYVMGDNCLIVIVLIVNIFSRLKSRSEKPYDIF